MFFGAPKRPLGAVLLVIVATVLASSIGAEATTTERAITLVDVELQPSTVAVALTGVATTGVEMRLQQGSTWSGWISVESPIEEAPDQATVGGPTSSESGTTISFGPVWLGENADRLEVRYRPTGSGLSGSVDAPQVHAITTDDIAPTDNTISGAAGEIGGPQPTGFGAGGSASGFAAGPSTAVRFLPGLQLLQAPTIRARASWATERWAVDAEGCESGPRIASSLKAAVVHHTVTGNIYSADDVDDILRAIHFTHTVINGWCDIGYNFVVDRFGNVWEGRTGSLDGQIIGGHTRGFNTTTVGIALLGQHQQGSTAAGSGVKPSLAARSAVQRVATWKLALHGVDPGGRTWLRNRSASNPLRLAGAEWHYVPTILGHRDLGVTSCPGHLAYGHVHRIGTEIQQTQNSNSVFARPAWVESTHGPAVVVASADGGLLVAGAGSRELTTAGSNGVAAGSVVAVAGDTSGGYRLHRNGSLTPFGLAADLGVRGGWLPAGVRPVDLAYSEEGGVWILASNGVIYPFGEAPSVDYEATGVEPVAFSLDPSGSGYVATAVGRLRPVGAARPIPEAAQPKGSIVDVAIATESGVADSTSSDVVWVLDSSGYVHLLRPTGTGTSYHFLDFLAGDRGQGLDIGSVDLSLLDATAVIASGDDQGAWVLDQYGQLWPIGDARLITPVSTRMSSANAVDVALLGHLAGEDFLTSDDARYIDALYQLFSGAKPSAGELSLGVYDLEIGVNRRVLTEHLVVGPGWAGSRVDDIYRRALAREPVTTGRQYWLGRLGAGMSFEQLGTLFYGSPEYYRSAGSHEAYVRRLYDALLGRDPAPSGLTYWTGLLDRGDVEPAGMAREFYRSLESRRDRTAQLYEEVLSRPPTTAELADGARLLTVVDDGDLAVDLAADAEFYRKVAEG